jgi:hypothetical protein
VSFLKCWHARVQEDAGRTNGAIDGGGAVADPNSRDPDDDRGAAAAADVITLSDDEDEPLPPTNGRVRDSLLMRRSSSPHTCCRDTVKSMHIGFWAFGKCCMKSRHTLSTMQGGGSRLGCLMM